MRDKLYASVSAKTVVTVVAVLLIAILGYVAFEYGWTKVPEFLMVSAFVIVAAFIGSMFLS